VLSFSATNYEQLEAFHKFVLVVDFFSELDSLADATAGCDRKNQTNQSCANPPAATSAYRRKTAG